MPDEALQAALGKLPGYAVRLALVLQLARWAEGEAQGEEIDSESMRRALGLADWFANEAARVYQLQDRQRDDRDVRRLLHYVQRQGGTVTLRKVQTNLRAFRTTAAAERGLQQLVDRGWAYWTLGERGRGVRVLGGVEEEAA